MKSKKMISVGLATLMGVAMMGCAPVQPPNAPVKPIDKAKAQLFVNNFNGGGGYEWLDKVIARFERDYAETSFLPETKGVQVYINNSKNNIMAAIPQLKDEVYFAEDVNYYDAISSGNLLEITDMVTEPLTEFGESGTIEDKLYEAQLDYWKTPNGKYYGLPHIQAPIVITYDIDLFNRLRLFFDDNGKIGKKNTDTGLGKGPDGKAGTYDDGCPATYEEFYTLCDTMKKRGVAPMVWSGMYAFYLSYFSAQLKADYEGAEEAKLFFTFDGTAKKLVDKIDKDGNITFKAPVTITENNGYEMYNSAGFYYALDFMEEIISKNYYANQSFNEAISHTDAQTLFLLSSFTSAQDIGMIVEGLWWVNEAKPTFENMSSYQGSSIKDRNLAVMPIPKATKAQIGEKTTFIDAINNAAFISAYIDESKIELAKTFLQYTSTQASLEEFVTTTGLMRGFDIDYTNILEELSPYTKSIIQAFEANDYLVSASGKSVFQKNYTDLNVGGMMSTDSYQYSTIGLKEGKTALEMFTQIRAKYTQSKWDIMLGK